MKKVKEKIKNAFIKNKNIVLIFSIIWIVVVAITLKSYNNSLGKESIGNYNFHKIIVLENNNKVTQIIDTEDGIDTVAVRLEVYKKNKSNITIDIIGHDSKKVYGSKTINSRDVLGANYNCIDLNEKIESSKENKLDICVYSDDNGSLGVWCSENNAFGDNKLFVNGDEQQGSMTVRMLRDNDIYYSFYQFVIIFAIVFVSFLIFVLLLDTKKEIIYTSITFLIGLLFILIITPISGPDEEYHYRRALEISNKLLLKENTNEIEEAYIDYFNFVSDYNVGIAYKNIVENYDMKLPDLKKEPIHDLATDAFGMYAYDLVYLPQALGITIARLLKLNFFFTYYFGRLFSLLFFCLCTYLSIKNTPVLKNMFGIFASLPLCLQQATTYGQDMWIIGLSMTILAYILKWLLDDEHISIKDYIVVLISNILLAPAKTIYSMVALLAWLVPNSRFSSKRIKLLVLALLSSPTIYYVGDSILSRIIPILQSIFTVSADDFGSGVVIDLKYEDHFSIRYIWHHPLQTIKIIFNTLRVNLKAWFAGAIGRYLSGLTLILPSTMSYFITGLLFVSVLFKEDYSISISFKVASVLVSIIIAMFALAAMLVGWTSIYDETIQGIQGRYFTPFLPYVLLAFNNKKIAIPKKFDKYLIFAQILVLFEVVVYIMSATFVY